MSRENVETVERAIEALNARDWDALGALVHGEFEFHSAFAALEGPRPYRGVADVVAVFDEYDAIWDDLQWRLDSIRDTEERSLVILHVTGIAAGSRVPLDQRIGQVWTWRDGKLARVVSHSDVTEALDAVGLSE